MWVGWICVCVSSVKVFEVDFYETYKIDGGFQGVSLLGMNEGNGMNDMFISKEWDACILTWVMKWNWFLVFRIEWNSVWFAGWQEDLIAGCKCLVWCFKCEAIVGIWSELTLQVTSGVFWQCASFPCTAMNNWIFCSQLLFLFNGCLEATGIFLNGKDGFFKQSTYEQCNSTGPIHGLHWSSLWLQWSILSWPCTRHDSIHTTHEQCQLLYYHFSFGNNCRHNAITITC